MKKITVTRQAILQMVREVLDNKTVGDLYGPEMAAKVNNQVAEPVKSTEPVNPNFVPRDKTEFTVALQNLTKNVADEKIPSVFDQVKGSILATAEESEDEMKKKETNKPINVTDVQAEAVIRAQVRKILRENPELNAYDAYDDAVRKNQKSEPARDGTTFEEIAQEFGFSVSGAKQFVDKTFARAKFVASMDINDRELLVLCATHAYIEYLTKSGELTNDDVELLKSNPDIIQDLDGFREFMHNWIRGAQKMGFEEFIEKKGYGHVLVANPRSYEG